uniref:Uncharacterized protein n=1 Tax=Timema douglasi TaxID=61478 RepID=A0A7R8VB33_TIMDO|nr:unnamed protein product [Timema douglasi]
MTHRGLSKTKRFTRNEDKKGRVRVMLQKVVVIFGIQTADPRGLLLLLCEYLTARILCLAITQSNDDSRLEAHTNSNYRITVEVPSARLCCKYLMPLDEVGPGFQLGQLPEPPKDCILRNRSESEGLEVACIPGFDGDLPQHFLLEVSESPSVTGFQTQIPHGVTSTMNDEGIRPRITGPPIYIELGAKPVFMLHSLEAGKDYELAVFARNDWGKSDPPVIIPKVRVTTAMEKLTGEVSEEAESGASTQPMAVVLGVIVVAAFLILGGIFVTAGLVICKRRSLASQGAAAPSSRPQQFPLDELLRESPPRTSLEAGCGGGMYHDELMNVMVHVPRVPRADVVILRKRFRNEDSEKESQPVTRTSIVEDEGGGGGSVTFNQRRAHNGAMAYNYKRKEERQLWDSGNIMGRVFAKRRAICSIMVEAKLITHTWLNTPLDESTANSKAQGLELEFCSGSRTVIISSPTNYIATKPNLFHELSRLILPTEGWKAILEPDLIVSRADMVLQIPISQPSL